MRIAKFLRASFVGALLFSPAMADDVEKVHDEALRALREELGQTNDLPSATQVTPQVAKERAEQRNADREKLQAERRQQFEQFVKERERVRQQQYEYDLNAAHQIGQIKPDNYNPAHSPALLALHGEQSAAAPMQLAQSDTDDVHAKALEVLHQQLQNQSVPTNAPTVKAQSSTTTSPSSSTTQPSPDLQRRLKQMQLELEQEELEKAKARGDAKPATVTIVPAAAATPATPTADAYTRDLEQRAQSTVEQSPAATPSTAPAGAATSAAPVGAPTATNPSQGLDATTREMIRRQDQEISNKMSTPAPTATAAKTPAPAATPLPQTLTPDQEAAAVAALRQQQQSTATAQTATPPKSNPTPATTSAKPTAAAKAPVVTQRTETDAAEVQYSRELEERARQILLERAQNQQATAAIQAAPAPVAVPVENFAPAPIQPTAPVVATPAPTPEPAPVATSAPLTQSSFFAPAADVQSQPQQAPEQIKAATAPRTRMERLKEITDLYRADKMSPAEYHQKRAQILAEPQ